MQVDLGVSTLAKYMVSEIFSIPHEINAPTIIEKIRTKNKKITQEICGAELHNIGALYKILFLYNCFLDGWLVELTNNKVKLYREKCNGFNLNNFITTNELIN